MQNKFRLSVLSLLIFILLSCSFSKNSKNPGSFEGSLTATPVSAGMIRLDFDCQTSENRVFGITRREPGSDSEYLTALPPTFSIYLDRDLSPGTVYTYSLYAYDGDDPVLLAEASASPQAVPVNVHYVRSDATGAGDGSSWTDAWTEIPKTLERGHTYFIADGTYPKTVFNDDESGSEFIFIKKATPGNHGSNIGWNDSYGQNQAVFTATEGTIITFETGYYDFDGQTGSGTSGHGFKTETASEFLTYSILVGFFTRPEGLESVNIYHTEMELWGCVRNHPENGDATETASGRGFQVAGTSGLHHSIVSNVYIHDLPGIPVYYAGDATDNIFEYSHVARNHVDAISHSEGIQTGRGANANIVRYNYWEDIEGTGGLVLKDDWEVYGNVFFNTPAYPHPGQNGMALSMGAVFGENGTKMYNNTVANIQVGINQSYHFTDTNNEACNNLWSNCSRLTFAASNNNPLAIDYNALYNSVNHTNHTEEHLQLIDSNPINSEFKPVFETDPGFELPFPYNIDPDGNVRGEDGVWTRGAFEYRD